VRGAPKDEFLKVAEWMSSTANGERAMGAGMMCMPAPIKELGWR